MITTNIEQLKINRLTQEQYDDAKEAGTLNANEIYLTPAQGGGGSEYVPITRKVNNKALSSDITLNASDVGAAPAYQYSTTDLTPGTSSLATGTLYFVYE